MERSIHDNVLLGYAVDCESHSIVLRTAHRLTARVEFTDIVFEGVAAYWFEGDNFGTLLTDISEIPARELFERCRARFKEGEAYLWPGPWNRSEASVLSHIENSAVSAFVLTSAYGMSGWVWARAMRLEARD